MCWTISSALFCFSNPVDMNLTENTIFSCLLHQINSNLQSQWSTDELYTYSCAYNWQPSSQNFWFILFNHFFPLDVRESAREVSPLAKYPLAPLTRAWVKRVSPLDIKLLRPKGSEDADPDPLELSPLNSLSPFSMASPRMELMIGAASFSTSGWTWLIRPPLWVLM